MTGTDLAREVDYRLAKWVAGILQEEGLLSKEEVCAVWKDLLDEFDPPFRSTETVSNKILDGEPWQ